MRHHSLVEAKAHEERLALLGAGTSLLLEGFALGGEGAQVVACHEGVALVREVRARPASSCESQPLSQVGISECSNRKAWYKSERISVA